MNKNWSFCQTWMQATCWWINEIDQWYLIKMYMFNALYTSSLYIAVSPYELYTVRNVFHKVLFKPLPLFLRSNVWFLVRLRWLFSFIQIGTSTPQTHNHKINPCNWPLNLRNIAYLVNIHNFALWIIENVLISHMRLFNIYINDNQACIALEISNVFILIYMLPVYYAQVLLITRDSSYSNACPKFGM